MPKISADEQEFFLRSKASEFERLYFSDMTLEEYAEDLSLDMQDIFVRTSIQNWMFKITNFRDKNISGMCYSKKRCIAIRYNNEWESSLLHEMIHAYEWMLQKKMPFHRDFVLIRLYKRLSKRLPYLINLLCTDLQEESLVHSPLFLLKSLDIDLKRKWPLGTTYSYGRLDLFSDPHTIIKAIYEMPEQPCLGLPK